MTNQVREALRFLERLGGPEPKPGLLCRIFGHRWREFDHDWCGTDYFVCWLCHVVESRPTKAHP